MNNSAIVCQVSNPDIEMSAASGVQEATPTGWLGAIRGGVRRNRWAVADQVLVSGMNFLTTAMLARMLGVYRFGVFSIFYTVLLYLSTFQLALIASPMLTLGPQIKDPEQRQSYLRGMGGYQRLFALACTVATILFALCDKLVPPRYRIPGSLVPAYVVTVLCYQLQDWYRRYCYAGDRARKAFSNDAISYGGQVAALCGLCWGHAMGVSSAYYAVGLTSLAAYAVGYCRDDIGAGWREICNAFSRSWDFGRSLLVASQSQWLGTYGLYLVVAAVAGVEAASGIRAAMAMVGPTAVLFRFIDNVVPVRAARTFTLGGERALMRYLRRTTLILVIVVGAPLTVLSLFAKETLSLVFGIGYARYASLVAWQAGYVFLLFAYTGLVYYHRTICNTRLLARSALVVAAVSLGGCVPLTRMFGAAGGMAALVAGQVLYLPLLALPMMRTRKQALTAR